MGIMYELMEEVNRSILQLKPFVNEAVDQIDSAIDAKNLLDYTDRQWEYLMGIYKNIDELQLKINCFVNSLEDFETK